MRFLFDFLDHVSSILGISRIDSEPERADKADSKLRVIKERRSRERRWVKKGYARRWKL
jgi:hypothetical protein